MPNNNHTLNPGEEDCWRLARTLMTARWETAGLSTPLLPCLLLLLLLVIFQADRGEKEGEGRRRCVCRCVCGGEGEGEGSESG